MRHIDYGEADRIVTLLTPGLGLVKGFARSARKSRKRFGVSLEPFCRIQVQWKAGRSELCSLQDADLIDSRTGLRGDLQRFALACYAVELTELLLHEGEPQPAIYHQLQAFLDYLSGGGEVSIARLLFELRLIQQLGYIPHLLHCSECFVDFTSGQAVFDVARGGSLCFACAGGSSGFEISVGTLGSLARSLQTPVILFEGFRFGEKTLTEGRELLDSVLRSVLPREPKSLHFLQVASLERDA